MPSLDLDMKGNFSQISKIINLKTTTKAYPRRWGPLHRSTNAIALLNRKINYHYEDSTRGLGLRTV